MNLNILYGTSMGGECSLAMEDEIRYGIAELFVFGEEVLKMEEDFEWDYRNS